MRTPKLVLLAFSALFLLAAGRAEARQVHFAGMHPIPAEYGGGFCQIDFPHVHVYEPNQAAVLYRNHDDGYAFVGDPAPYGYDGPKQAYYGPHPITSEDGVVEYCYIDGPHYHAFPPAAPAQFNLKGGVYFYAGHFPQAYYEARPRYTRVNAVYRPLVYQRPVVVVDPPGAVVVEQPAPTYVVPAAGAGVVAGVGVSAGVGIHAGVGVGAGVVVGAPAPVVVAPAPVYVAPGRTVIIHDRPEVIHEREVIEVREKHHHDEGKHWGRKW
jgi:hypothetical protein